MVVPNAEPDSRADIPVLRQAWRTVTFVHWQVDGKLLRALLPRELAVDEYAGSGWVTLTPLLMDRVRFAGLPPLPGIARFFETNLRTYVVGPRGRRGVWFFSLDAASLAVTLGARVLLGAPYFVAELRIDELADGTEIHYRGERLRPGRRAAYRMTVEPGDPKSPGPLDTWLTSRWRAFTSHLGRIVEVPVRHGTWPLRHATLRDLDETVTAAAGLAVGAPELVHFSDGLGDVSFGIASSQRRDVSRLPGLLGRGSPKRGDRTPRWFSA